VSDRHFFIQAAARGPWHVESDEDCEVMLCGAVILVTSRARIQNNWGPRKCPDCWMRLEELHRIESLAPHRSSSRIPSLSER
jgi:hypothetical protein